MPNNNRLAALLAVLLTVCAAYAQDEATVSGTVTNSVSGAPVSRAHVAVTGGRQRYGALTNGEGKYSITGLPPSTYNFQVERVGFVWKPRSTDGMQLELRAGDKRKSVELTLTPLGGITGRVLDADGEPVQLARVMAQGSDTEAVATTDNKGQYRIGGLAPGKYRVRASVLTRQLPPETRTDGSKEIHYSATYAPAVLSRKEAARVAVPAGSDADGIDIRLAATPIVKVSGKVLDVPAGEALLQISHSTSRFGSIGYVEPLKADGTFVIWGLDFGKYTLQAILNGMGRNAPQSAPLDLEIGTSDVEHLELRMIAPFDIAGQLRVEDEHAKASLKPDGDEPPGGTETQILLQPIGEGNTVEGEIGANDSFHFEKVPPGRYRMEVQGRSQGYVKSMQWGALQVDGNVLDVGRGPSTGVLTVLMSAQTGEIGGTVSDSKGAVAQALVHLMLDDMEIAMGTQTDATGHYSFPQLRPGKYRLLSTSTGGPDMVLDNSMLDDFDDVAVTVELRAGDKATQDLKQAPPAK